MPSVLLRVFTPVSLRRGRGWESLWETTMSATTSKLHPCVSRWWITSVLTGIKAAHLKDDKKPIGLRVDGLLSFLAAERSSFDGNGKKWIDRGTRRGVTSRLEIILGDMVRRGELFRLEDLYVVPDAKDKKEAA